MGNTFSISSAQEAIMHTMNERKGALEQFMRTVSTETGMHPLRSLRGAAYAAIEPFIASVDDDTWERVFGLRVAIHGGCELQVDNTRLDKLCEDIEYGGTINELAISIPMIIDDPYLPRMGVAIQLADLIRKCNALPAHRTGPRHVLGRKRCAHRPYPNSEPGCLSCVHRWWQDKANGLGMLGREAV